MNPALLGTCFWPVPEKALGPVSWALLKTDLGAEGKEMAHEAKGEGCREGGKVVPAWGPTCREQGQLAPAAHVSACTTWEACRRPALTPGLWPGSLWTVFLVNSLSDIFLFIYF